VGLELARAFVTVRGDASRIRQDFSAMRTPVVAETAKIGAAAGRAFSAAMAAAGVLGYVGIFSLAAGEAALFERKMVDVRANARLLGEEGAESFELLAETARRLGATTEFSAKQAAEALDWMVLGGLNAREATEAVSGVLNLASSANIQLAESAKIVVDNMRKYGMEASETGKVADFLSSAQSRAQITALDLSQGLRSLGAVTSSMNVSFRDTVALLTGMGRAGTEMSKAGSSLGMALFRLASQPKEVADALREMNIQVESFVDESSGMLNIVGLFKSIAEAMPTNPIKQVAAAAALFGARGREILGLINLMKGTTFVEETQIGLLEDMGRAAEVSEAKLDTFWGTLRELRSVLGELAIAGLTPVLKELGPLLDGIKASTAMFTVLVTWVNKTADAFSSLPFAFVLSGFWDLIIVGGALTGVIITLELLVAKLGLAFAALHGPVGIATLVLGKWKIVVIALAGFIKAGLVVAIGALVIAMTAIAAHPIPAFLIGIIGIVVQLGKEWEKVNAIVKEGNKISAEFVQRGEKREANLAKQATRLLELSKVGRLNNKDMKEALGIIDDLEGLYGSLGLTIDRTTGGIVGVTKAIELLAEKNRKSRINDLSRHLSDLAKQSRIAEKASHTLFRDQQGAMLEHIRLMEKMAEVQEELFELRTAPIGIPGMGEGVGDNKAFDEFKKRMAEEKKERRKKLFEERRELTSEVQRHDPSSVRKEFQLLHMQVAAIVNQFPQLHGAASRFLEAEWKRNPFGKVAEQIKQAKSKTDSLKRGWEGWRLELEKFSRQDWVSPVQVRQMRNMLVLQDRLEKQRERTTSLKGMAQSIREELETPVQKVKKLAVEVGTLVARGEQGLPGSLSREEAIKRLMLERKRIAEEGPGRGIGMEAGRFGFANFGKSLQDAMLKSDDPAKMTAKNTAMTNKLLDKIDQAVRVLGEKPQAPAVHGK